jgi:hypothetical protein
LSPETLAALGIGRPRVPAPSVWCELFRDPGSFGSPLYDGGDGLAAVFGEVFETLDNFQSHPA